MKVIKKSLDFFPILGKINETRLWRSGGREEGPMTEGGGETRGVSLLVFFVIVSLDSFKLYSIPYYQFGKNIIKMYILV